MQIARLVAVLSLLATLSGCVLVSSHSYSYTTVERRPPVSQTDWTWSFLHLTEPLIENLVVDLTHSLESQCGGTALTNVQTKLMLREFILLQFYSVRLSGTCAGAVAPSPPPS